MSGDLWLVYCTAAVVNGNWGFRGSMSWTAGRGSVSSLPGVTWVLSNQSWRYYSLIGSWGLCLAAAGGGRGDREEGGEVRGQPTQGGSERGWEWKAGVSSILCLYVIKKIGEDPTKSTASFPHQDPSKAAVGLEQVWREVFDWMYGTVKLGDTRRDRTMPLWRDAGCKAALAMWGQQGHIAFGNNTQGKDKTRRRQPVI